MCLPQIRYLKKKPKKPWLIVIKGGGWSRVVCHDPCPKWPWLQKKKKKKKEKRKKNVGNF